MTDTAETQPEKLPLTSMDIAEEKRELLKKCLAAAFPEAVAEDKIDLDQLKRVLGEWVEPDRERFGLNWPGKAACMKVIQAPSVGTLKPCPEQSVNWDTTENLFIEGDNLEVLKLLQKAYFGKIKMIYIDPPYNTGNDFIYPDKYSETLDTYLEYTGQKDSEGKRFSTNTDTSGRFHTKWINMMYPRIYLAKNLLRQDGVIFISIGDSEQAHLKKICDEIFGENNFIANIARMAKSGGAKARFFTPNLDYVLVYARNIEEAEPFRSKINEKQKSGYYKFTQADGSRQGEIFGEERLYKASLDPRPNQRYWIACPDGSFAIPPGVTFPSEVAQGSKVLPTSEDGVWKWTFSRYESELNADNIIFKKSDRSALIDQDGNPSNWNIYNKLWLKDQEEKGMAPSNIITQFENRQSSAELKKLGIPFDYAKPTGLLSYLIEIARCESGDVVLDFFAGSGSMGEAVVRHSIAQGNRLNHISIQLPEVTDPESEEYKAGYPTISQLGIARLKKVAEQTEVVEADGCDAGFRVFQLSSSCFASWDGDLAGKEDAELLFRLDAHADHIDASVGGEEILFELLLKDGFPLTVPMKKMEITGKQVFSIADGALLICLEKELTQELMDALAEMEPARVICLDAGFSGNDQLKANAVQTFKARARTKETAIEFRTV